jgi:hypothetical protein
MDRLSLSTKSLEKLGLTQPSCSSAQTTSHDVHPAQNE